MDAALEIASTHGLDALSIKNVADAADYTPGALYRYFPSKDALLAAVATHVIGKLGARLDAVDGEGLARLRRQVDEYIRFSREQPHRFALLSSMFGDARVLIPEAEQAEKVGASMYAALVPVAASFAKAVERGELDPGASEERVLTLFAGLQGALQMRKQERVMPALVDSERLARTMTSTLLAGWGATS